MNSPRNVTQFGRIPIAARIAGTLCLIALATRPAAAQSLINLHFGASAYTGTTETSPARQSGSAGTWNEITSGLLNADVPVVYSDGSAGPTLSFDATSTTNVWTGNSFTASTVDYTTGVYDVANLYESGLINSGNATTGFRIKGLAPGVYQVFLVPIFRNAKPADVKADPTVVFMIGLGNNTDLRNTGDFSLTSTGASPTQNIATNLTSWIAANDGSSPYNYLGATVTIDSIDRWLTFFLQDSGAASTPDRPAPSVIQLLAVPEPASAALCGCGSGFLALRRRRKRH
jgi:hypothetical protein